MTLEARPSAGYVFDRWIGSVAGIVDVTQAIVSFEMGDARVRMIIASFIASDLRHGVTAIVEPSGGGSVRFLPPQPSGGYRVNENVSVRAVEQTGYVFSRWAGDLAGNENPRSILVSDDKTFTAIFNPTATIYCGPPEGGSVALKPVQSINGYTAGTEVAISATATKGYRFVSWEGDVSTSANPVTVTMDAPKTITARFVEKSSSRLWLWVIIGLAGLLCGLVLVRVMNARMNSGVEDEPPEFGE